jgi:hypothetical protein
VDLEEKYAVALGILSIVLWAGGWVLAMFTFACFAVFVAIARHNVKG